MLNNYMNPGNLKPTFSNPGMAGGAEWTDRGMYEKSIGLIQILQAIEAQKQQEDLTQGAPVRDMQRRADLAKHGLSALMDTDRQAPAHRAGMLAGELGQAQSLAAKGVVDSATVPDQIMKSRTGAQEQAIQWLNVLNGQLQMAGPQAGALYQQALQQIPEPARKMLPAQYDQNTPAIIKGLMERVMNNPEHQRTMAVHAADNTSRERVGAGHDAATRYTADQRYNAAYLNMKPEVKAKLDNVAAELVMKVATGKATPQEIATLQYIQNFQMGIRAAGVANTMDPNAIPANLLNQNPGNRGVPPPAPVPQAGGGATPSPQVTLQGNIQQMVEQSGERYDPTTYDYRIVNGKVYKKQKAKK